MPFFRGTLKYLENLKKALLRVWLSQVHILDEMFFIYRQVMLRKIKFVLRGTHRQLISFKHFSQCINQPFKASRFG
jgi:hypothetical protein